MTTTIALFGEAEKGEYNKGYYCKELPQLVDIFGNPPENSEGLYYAVQSLLYQFPLIYFRIEEEGGHIEEYLQGMRLLEESPLLASVSAICTPGVGTPEMVDTIVPFCKEHHQLWVISEKDLFDYLLSLHSVANR
jgi:hypothetical protein